MTMDRAHLVDSAVTRWYHCVTRCVRRAFLLGEGPAGNRKQWIEHRLEELAEEQDMHHNRDSTMRASSAKPALREGVAASEARGAGRARTTNERWTAEGTGLSRDMTDGAG